MSYPFTPSIKTSPTYFKKRAKDASRNEKYVDLVFRSAHKTKGFSEKQSKAVFLTQLLHGYGVPEHIPASSILSRQKGEEQLISILFQKYFDVLVHRSEELYSLTFVHPDHRTGDRQCEVNLEHMRKQVWNLMRPIARDYIGILEFDVTVNEKSVSDPENGGRDVAPHVHILFWTSKEIQPKLLSEKLSKKFGEHKDGMKTVVIKRCEGSEGDLVRLASYLFKSPSGGKTKVFRKTRDADGNLIKAEERRKPVGKGARPIIVSRQAEILSHFDLRKLLISGGGGNEIKEYINKALLAEAKMFQGFAPEAFGYQKIRRFWKMMRQKGWGKGYPEPKIKGLPSTKPANQ